MESVSFRNLVSKKINTVFYKVRFSFSSNCANEFLAFQGAVDKLSCASISSIRVSKESLGYLFSINLSDSNTIAICYNTESATYSCKTSTDLKVETLLREFRGCIYNMVRKYETLLSSVPCIILSGGSLNYSK